MVPKQYKNLRFDSGSMITSISDSFYDSLKPQPPLRDITEFGLSVLGANGSHLPYKDYIEADISVPFLHTCHTSHCETKSHRILALLDPISHKIFKSHRIFIPFNKLLFEELEINHTLAWLSQA